MLILAGLVLVFFLTRLVNLSILPIFADEAIYIRWAQQVWQGRFFIPLTDGKTPLFMWLLAPWLQIIKDPLIAGRTLSVVSGLGTILGIYFFSKKLFNQKTALLAAFLAIFQPFLLFSDRLSLVDSLLTALIIWSFYLAYLLFQTPNFKLAFVLGCLWAAALLTKPSAALFILLTPSLLFLKPTKHWLKIIKSLLLPGSLALVLGFGLYNLQRLSDAFHLINLRSVDYLRSPAEIFSHWFEFFPDTFLVYFNWLVSYLSWPALGLLIIAWFLSLKTKYRLINLLSLWIFLPLIAQATIGKIIYPRYLLPIVPFILITLAWFLLKLKKPLTLIGLALLAVFWLRFDYWLLVDPVKAPLNSWEKDQYFNAWSSGYGLKQITTYLQALPPGDKPVFVATEGSFGTLPDGLEIYFHADPHIWIQGVGFPQDGFHPDMETALSESRLVYFVFNQNRVGSVNPSRLQLIDQYPRPTGETLMFYQLLPKD